MSSRPSGRPASASTAARESRSAHCRDSPSRCTHSLGRGDVGSDVKRLQRFLFGQGFTYVPVSGVFDDATFRGVAQYQRNRGITGDPPGVFGPATRTSWEAAERSMAPAPATGPPGSRRVAG
ncbi:peptidoglycan-binding domain-containing protein [Streptomyces griseochromogenes]|uniref:peptidoglycan-binding domain-containing protein n=1 Tax=Streptomyces griseochromogenes TaxID=68214 RepID=UPI0035590D85